MGKEKIKKTIKIFVKRVNQKFKPEKIILFGSYAKGKVKENSDIDILVISKAFNEMKPFDRSIMLHSLAQDLKPDINAFWFTPLEIKSLHSSVIQNALSKGIVL